MAGQQMIAAPTSTAGLYPPERPTEVRAALREVASSELDREARMILKRALTPPERAALVARRDALARWCEPSPRGPRDIAKVCTRCLTGFGRRGESEDEAQMVGAQYGDALKEIPAWAVERAFMRFASGDVRPDELGPKQVIDFRWGPSSAQVGVIARAIAKPFQAERRLIGSVIAGVLPKPEPGPRTEVEQARVDELVEGAVKTFDASRAKSYLEQINAEARSKAMAQERQRRSLEDTIAGYTARGLKPPAPASNGYVPRVETALTLGWTIEEVGEGERALVAPRRSVRAGCAGCGRVSSKDWSYSMCRKKDCPVVGAGAAA